MRRIIKITLDTKYISLLHLAPILADTHIRDMRSSRHNLIFQNRSISGFGVMSATVCVDLFGGAGEFVVDVEFDLGTACLWINLLLREKGKGKGVGDYHHAYVPVQKQIHHHVS